MRANIEFLSRKYREFNDLCFGGTLPEVPLRISRSRRTLGCLKYRRSRRLFGKDRLTDFSIWISNCLDLSQDVIEDTLIHEMIHLYIHSNGLRDTSAHGELFRKWMRRINTLHGRHITISRRSSAEENATDMVRRGHYICVTRLRTGETMITVAARTRVFDLHRQLESLSEVDSFEWRYSESAAFNRFPRSRTLKFYRIAIDIMEALGEARTCLCDGRSLRFAPAK